ncbi:MAG: hypothetical protein AAGG09_06650 [Pseudomonadota bacterium]
MVRRSLFCALAASTLLAGGAASAEPAILRPAGDWQMDVTWWLFSPISTTGTSTVAGQPADLDLDLQDALELLDFASSLRFEAWRGDFGLIVDANYLGISEEGSTTLGGGPFARDLDAEVEAVQSWISLLAAYRFAKGTNARGKAYAFDVQAGARYNNLTQDVDIEGPFRSVSLGGSEHWWEPVIGARGAWELDDDWSFAAGADFSGFGAGGNDLAWSATAAFDWSFSESGSVKFGYRYYSIDFESEKSDGTFGWDVEQHGPFFGVTFALN